MAVRFAMLKHKGRQMAAETVPTDGNNVVELAADIVSAYVSNNSVPTGDLPALINEVHAALKRAGTPAADAPRGEPAVPIKKSITPDYLISLFDGKKYKSLKRHLRTSHNMTPQEYRTFWNLAPDYPMVAPNYAKARSELAKTLGLGQQRRKQPGKRRTNKQLV
jgi:predicted transcriptional regulator